MNRDHTKDPILKLEITKQLIENHSEEFFPFMRVPDNSRYRTIFIQHLCSLQFDITKAVQDFEKSLSFERFVSPISEVLRTISSFRVRIAFEFCFANICAQPCGCNNVLNFSCTLYSRSS